METKTYRIELIEGDFFGVGDDNSQHFFDSLFNSFSLLSWLSQASQINILDEENFEVEDNRVYKVQTFTSNTDALFKFLVEIEKDKAKKTIEYCILKYFDEHSYQKCLKGAKSTIEVSFSMHKQFSKLKTHQDETNNKTDRNTIFIDIKDESNSLDRLGKMSTDRRINLKKNFLKPHEIQYFYKEPHSQRFKDIPNCHFSLAFQGGGAKAVSYTGVFKALRQLHRDTPITSVIGSSAGGLLALAIGTQMKPDAMSNLSLRMDSIPRDKKFCSQEDIKPEQQKQFDEQIQKIKCLLHNYGILENSIFDQIIQSFSDLETHEKILDVLELINPSMAMLFTLQLKNPVSKGWFSSEKYTKRLNYYGLLQGGIMNGTAYSNLAAHIIKDYFVKHFNKNYMKKHPQDKQKKNKILKLLHQWEIDTEKQQIQVQEQLESEEYMDKIKNITLKQFYEISEVEFTFTAVDLDDKVLRLFNQKTAPNLPVCKAIQMSGSFPVAFKAQKWEKHFGKYYIHYSNIRKQIDLTGHTFTDGGILANFPIKYIDNQQMRPMYFSHTRHPKNTILYGFGLQQIPDKIDEQHEKQKQKAIAELKDHLLSKISKFTLVKNLIFSDSKSEMEKTLLSQVPVFKFLELLLQTLPVSDYNLNIECFRQSIILTEIGARAIKPKRNANKEISKFTKFKQCIENLYQCSLSKLNIQPKQLLKSTCQRVKGSLNEFQTPVNELIETIRTNILNSLYNFQGTRILNRISQSKKLNFIIRELEQIYSPEVFNMQETTSVKVKILGIIKEIEQYFLNMNSSKNQQTQTVVKSMIKNQLAILQKTSGRISQIIFNLQNQGKKEIDSDDYYNFSSLDTDIIFDLANIESKFFIIDQPYVAEIFKQINSLNIARIKIQHQIIKQRPLIDFQLRQIIKKTNKKKIHLVLESKENSHLYYSSMFEIFQNILHEEQYKDKRIDMITTSDIHSVFAFLLAGGKKISNIRKQMWKAKNLVTFQTGILDEYETFNWARTESRQMQELLELAWNNQYQIFEEMQQYLMGEGQQQDLIQQVKLMKNQFEYSKDHVTNSMSKILDHVVKSSYEVVKIKDNKQLQNKKLAQLLSLKNGPNGKNYTQKNKMISQNTKRLIRMLMIHFEQLLVDLIVNKGIVKDTFQLGIDQKMTEIVWKGFIVRKILSAKKLQFYIKQKLEQMKLNPNTTLGQYYQSCQRKITINFSLINKNEERMQIINRFTRPNMPVWAAIVASTSMPYMLPDFSTHEEWQFNPFSDSKMRKLMHYFFDSAKKRSQQCYISGNFISTLPLELLTNSKIAGSCFVDPKEKQQQYQKTLSLYRSTKSEIYASKLTQSKGTSSQAQSQYAVITFAFHKVVPNAKKQLVQKTPSKKFFDFSNVLNLGIDFLMGKFKNIEVGLKGIINRLEILKYFSIGIECHDNTIMKLYYEQTIKLPISLGTLDFYKIQSGRSELLHSYIYQSQFIVRGIFENLCINEGKDDFYYLAKKSTYIQYEVINDEIHLQFISKSKWNRKLATMYKVFWKIEESDRYISYDERQIVIPASTKQMFIKFDYPDLLNVTRKTHQMIFNFEKLQNIDQTVFFKFNYEDLDKRYLLPVPLSNKRLNTRVIPHSKAMLSEPKIEDSCITLFVEPQSIRIKSRTQDKMNSIAKDVCIKSNRSIDQRQVYNENSSVQSRQFSRKEVPGGCSYLLIKTKVVFKNDGLHCKGCVHPLTRTQKISAASDGHNEQIELSWCSKCHKKNTIIGYKCQNDKCTSKGTNQYCFPCLFVYAVYLEDGNYNCSMLNHKLEFYSPNTRCAKEIVLCHFCSTATTSYYQDKQCNINMCLKCSLVLEARNAAI